VTVFDFSRSTWDTKVSIPPLNTGKSLAKSIKPGTISFGRIMVENENPVKSAIFNHLWLGNQIHPRPWIIPLLGSVSTFALHNVCIFQ
jgi:hypothetical protein